jgi:hypothetical protein
MMRMGFRFRLWARIKGRGKAWSYSVRLISTVNRSSWRMRTSHNQPYHRIRPQRSRRAETVSSTSLHNHTQIHTQILRPLPATPYPNRLLHFPCHSPNPRTCTRTCTKVRARRLRTHSRMLWRRRCRCRWPGVNGMRLRAVFCVLGLNWGIGCEDGVYPSVGHAAACIDDDVCGRVPCRWWVLERRGEWGCYGAELLWMMTRESHANGDVLDKQDSEVVWENDQINIAPRNLMARTFQFAPECKSPTWSPEVLISIQRQQILSI